MFLSSSQKRIWTKGVYFHVLHTCVKPNQSRLNNKYIMTNISPISMLIDCPEKP